MALGWEARAEGGFYSVCVGPESRASADNTVALGTSAKALDRYTIALGSSAQAQGSYSIIVGSDARVNGQYSTALGPWVICASEFAVAIGSYATTDALAPSSVAVGSNARTGGSSSVAVGANAKANAPNSIVLNGNGTELISSASGFYVSPVRSLATGAANLAYDPASNEIYVASSSRRYKTDIQDVTASDSAHVWDLRPVSYRAIEEAATNKNAPVYYGFIAEEVAEVDPRLCFWGQDAAGMPQVEGVNYDQVIPLLLQEAKQLKAAREIDGAEIAALKAEIAALKALVLQVQQLATGQNI